MEKVKSDDFFKKFFEEEQRLFEQLTAIDHEQRELGEYQFRYITKSFTDRKAFYQIFDQTPRKYILAWVLGESAYPGWGSEVRLPKKQVEEMINSRDHIEEVINERKKANA